MAKLGLVLVLVVESFDPIVCASAAFALGAALGVRELAQLRSVQVVVPPSVLHRVEVVATFMVVRNILLKALFSFEIC
jgi:hypothetical protein